MNLVRSFTSKQCPIRNFWPLVKIGDFDTLQIQARTPAGHYHALWKGVALVGKLSTAVNRDGNNNDRWQGFCHVQNTLNLINQLGRERGHDVQDLQLERRWIQQETDM